MADKMKMFKTFFPIRIKIREVKKFPEKFNDGFLLGPRLVRIACEGTYKIYSYLKSETKEINEGKKVQRKPMEGIEEDIQWSGETRGKWSYCSRERWRSMVWRGEKLRKTGARELVGWHVTGIFARVSASNNGRCSFNWRYTRPRCSHVSWSRIKACCNGNSKLNRTKATDNGDVRFFCIGGDYGDIFYKRFPSNERVMKIATRCIACLSIVNNVDGRRVW